MRRTSPGGQDALDTVTFTQRFRSPDADMITTRDDDSRSVCYHFNLRTQPAEPDEDHELLKAEMPCNAIKPRPAVEPVSPSCPGCHKRVLILRIAMRGAPRVNEPTRPLCASCILQHMKHYSDCHWQLRSAQAVHAGAARFKVSN